MVPFIEKTFPRGGKKPALSQTSRNSKYSLFKKPKKKLNKVKKKKETPKGQKKITNNTTLNLNDSLEVRVVEDLKRNVIQEGMLVLGIVNRVTNKVVNMTLPGGIQGVVNISDMSEFYVNLVQNDLDVPILQEIFKVGDAFPVKILSLSQSSNNMFNVTTDPKKINSKLTYNSIEEGFILVGNVRSEEDHGYVIDFGIEETKGFLHHNKVENGCKLQIGQIIKCAVVQRILSHGSCNVQVTMSPTDLKLSTINKTSKLPIHCFIPGFQFKVSVKKVLNQGLEISYRNDNSCKGFVHEDYLPEPFPKLDTYLNNNERLSTLLYVKPFVNFPFFMVNNQKSFKWHYEIGEIVSGKVVKTTKRGVWFRVGDNSTLTKVFVPVSGLQESKKINDEKEDIYALYPVGKEVSQIRLTRTDLIRKYYVGLADKASLKEKYFCMSDIHIGDVVPCEITHIEGNRATVSIGQGLIGHVYAQDMTDVPLKNPQKKFTPGQKVKARVVEIMDAKVITLTMKPTLVKSKDPILMDYKDAKIGEPYTGTIVKIYPNGLLVAFFNGIKGYVSKKDTPFGEGESLEDNFTEGQLIKCSVLATDHKTKMFLTLNAPGQDENSLKVKVGKKYNVKVLTVGKDMLTVNVEVKPNKWTKGLIPNQLLSKYHNLGPAYLETFKEGETFEAYCVYKPDDTKKPRLSPADLFGEFYEATPRKELKNLLQVDTILPFIYKYKDAEMNAFHFCPVIPGFGDTDAIVQNTTPDKWSLMKFKRCQIVYGKIRDVDESIKISIKLNDVWNKEIQSSLSFLDSYIIEMDRLIERQKILNKKYLKKITLGREVEGKVKELEENGAVIEINSETNGFAFGKFSENESVTGKVAWVDGAKKRVYINTQKECVADINKDQKSPLELDDGHYRARIVYVDRNLTIAALKGRGNGKLVFLPCKRHLNDFFPPIHTYKIGDIIKVHATKLNSERLLGIDHDIYRLQSKKTWKDSVAELKKSVKNLKRKNKKGDEGPSKKNCKINGGGNDVEIIEEILNESVIDEIKQEVEEDESLENFKNDFKKVNGNCNHEGSDEEIEIKSEDESDITLEKDEEKNKKHKNKKDKSKKNSSSIENLFAENEIKSEESDSDEGEEGEHNREKIDVSSSSDDESEDENDKVENPKDVAISKVGFTWDVLKNPDLLSGAISKEEESSDDEEEDEEASKKKQKKTKKMTENEKRELAKKEEERLRRIEEELMDSNREPQSVDDFDRAVLANPDSSALWLKYMAFHLQGTEIEKARAVARRALKNISFREEQEKLNVWTALLNLENLYGNDETFNKTKDEALQLNDDYKIHLHILNMYAQSNKLQDAERLGFFMLKKYKDQKDVWREVAAVHYSVGKLETARNVLQKALASLDKKDHIELISKFAQLENKYGSSERAQTLYETVLGSFPKRVDVWCAYVDMMVKSKQIELARQVLERATSQVLPPKKMKTLFKKFIEFEETHGTTENVDKVREAAVEYIKNVSNLKSS